LKNRKGGENIEKHRKKGKRKEEERRTKKLRLRGKGPIQKVFKASALV
jgi:hypothetical protein